MKESYAKKNIANKDNSANDNTYEPGELYTMRIEIGNISKWY